MELIVDSFLSNLCPKKVRVRVLNMNFFANKRCTNTSLFLCYWNIYLIQFFNPRLIYSKLLKFLRLKIVKHFQKEAIIIEPKGGDQNHFLSLQNSLNRSKNNPKPFPFRELNYLYTGIGMQRIIYSLARIMLYCLVLFNLEKI